MRAARALSSTAAVRPPRPPHSAEASSHERMLQPHPEYDRGGEGHSLLYPDSHPPKVLNLRPSTMQHPPPQPVQPAFAAYGRSRGRRTLHDEQIAPRRAVLTPHAAAAAAAARERRRAGQPTASAPAAAPCAVAPPEQRSGAGRGCGPHPEYDPANSRAASLLYPDRTMYREGCKSGAAGHGGGGSTAPCAAGDAMLCAPPDGGCTAPQPLQSAAPPLAPSHVDGQRPQALDAERDEEVVAALRMQVAALTALLENGVCVPLPVGAAHEVAEGGGAAHRAAEAPSAAPLPPQPRQLLRVWFETRSLPCGPRQRHDMMNGTRRRGGGSSASGARQGGMEGWQWELLRTAR